MGPDGVRRLAAEVWGCVGLQELSVNRCAIGDEGAVALAQALERGWGQVPHADQARRELQRDRRRGGRGALCRGRGDAPLGGAGPAEQQAERRRGEREAARVGRGLCCARAFLPARLSVRVRGVASLSRHTPRPKRLAARAPALMVGLLKSPHTRRSLCLELGSVSLTRPCALACRVWPRKPEHGWVWGTEAEAWAIERCVVSVSIAAQPGSACARLAGPHTRRPSDPHIRRPSDPQTLRPRLHRPRARRGSGVRLSSSSGVQPVSWPESARSTDLEAGAGPHLTC
eukprot:1993582-Rhodomonas_salina.2